MNVRQTLGYQPALDGLRALSIIAVILYHADIQWIPGGLSRSGSNCDGVDKWLVVDCC